MYSLSLALLLLLLAGFVLFPESVNNITYARVPPEVRPNPAGHVMVGSLAYLVFCTLLFGAVRQVHPQLLPALGSTFNTNLGYIGGAFFAFVGLWSCLRPAASLKRLVPQMRDLPASSVESQRNLMLFAKGIGLVELTVASFCISPIFL